MFKKSKSETFTHKFDNYKLRTLNFMNIVKSIDSKNFYMYDISELLFAIKILKDVPLIMEMICCIVMIII